MIECKTLVDTVNEICEVLNNSITSINEECVFECENIYEKARSKRFLTIRFNVVDDAWCITETCTTGTSIFNDNDIRPLEQFKTYQSSSLFDGEVLCALTPQTTIKSKEFRDIIFNWISAESDISKDISYTIELKDRASTEKEEPIMIKSLLELINDEHRAVAELREFADTHDCRQNYSTIARYVKDINDIRAQIKSYISEPNMNGLDIVKLMQGTTNDHDSDTSHSGVDSGDVEWEPVILFDKLCMFCDYRVATEGPEFDGLYVYNLRHGDDNWSDPTTIEKSVNINFCGTIVSNIPLKALEKDPEDAYLITPDDWTRYPEEEQGVWPEIVKFPHSLEEYNNMDDPTTWVIQESTV